MSIRYHQPSRQRECSLHPWGPVAGIVCQTGPWCFLVCTSAENHTLGFCIASVVGRVGPCAVVCQRSSQVVCDLSQPWSAAHISRYGSQLCQTQLPAFLCQCLGSCSVCLIKCFWCKGDWPVILEKGCAHSFLACIHIQGNRFLWVIVCQTSLTGQNCFQFVEAVDVIFVQDKRCSLLQEVSEGLWFITEIWDEWCYVCHDAKELLEIFFCLWYRHLLDSLDLLRIKFYSFRRVDISKEGNLWFADVTFFRVEDQSARFCSIIRLWGCGHDLHPSHGRIHHRGCLWLLVGLWVSRPFLPGRCLESRLVQKEVWSSSSVQKVFWTWWVADCLAPGRLTSIQLLHPVYWTHEC